LPIAVVLLLRLVTEQSLVRQRPFVVEHEAHGRPRLHGDGRRLEGEIDQAHLDDLVGRRVRGEAAAGVARAGIRTACCGQQRTDEYAYESRTENRHAYRHAY